MPYLGGSPVYGRTALPFQHLGSRGVEVAVAGRVVRGGFGLWGSFAGWSFCRGAGRGVAPEDPCPPC